MSARGLCQCGCGGRTRVADESDAAKGWIKGTPLRFISHHYARAESRKRSVMARLLPRLEYIEATGCIEYNGATNARGYGRISIGARGEGMAMTHRVMYEWAKGPIPEGLTIDHLCRNTTCCNPSHLEAVTQAENNRRMWRDTRWTHCKRGHEYTEENARIHRRSDGSQWRSCRTCERAARQSRKRAA